MLRVKLSKLTQSESMGSYIAKRTCFPSQVHHIGALFVSRNVLRVESVQRHLFHIPVAAACNAALIGISGCDCVAMELVTPAHPHRGDTSGSQQSQAGNGVVAEARHRLGQKGPEEYEIALLSQEHLSPSP
mmetsp:Transcript_4273/g.9231  ORF Transcript_4273/g.9231 Transcript_4273/m.9231 type:complete len:131 (+) Transcript_4273:72-464(+)